ncbi:MAG: Rab family GTPase [Bacteroidota bacterium]
MINKKVILTGSFGVGKTSLFHQFIYSRFSDKYLTTIGVKVNRKVIKVNDQDLTIFLWDIAGEVSQDKVPVSYFLGASGIIYVFDLTRPSTYRNINEDLAYLNDLLPDVEVKVVGNKKDLVTQQQIDELLAEISVKDVVITSAKTGENVEELFHMLGEAMINE